MPRTYRQIDLAERRTIFRLLNAKTPIATIAQELDRHRSTIHREIRRNHFHGQREYAGYYPLNAQDQASEHRQLADRRSGRVECGRSYAAAATPVISAQSSKALVRAARYSVAVTCSRQRGKRLLIWS